MIDFELPYVGGIMFNHITSPGFLMAGLWFIQLCFVVFAFSEPFRINNAHKTDKKRNKEKESFVSGIRTVFGLVFSNPALPLTLLIFGYIEMICEVLISSCAMISRRYFGWNGSVAGFLIASLGALVLPAHFVVERASRSFDERSIMKVSPPISHSLHQRHVIQLNSTKILFFLTSVLDDVHCFQSFRDRKL